MVIFIYKSSAFSRSHQRLSGIYHSVRWDFPSCGDILLSPELLLKPLLVTLALPVLPEGNLRLRRSISFCFQTRNWILQIKISLDRVPFTPLLPRWISGYGTLFSKPPTTPICSPPTSTCLTYQKPIFKAGDFHLTTSLNPRSESGLKIRTIYSTALAWRISS